MTRLTPIFLVCLRLAIGWHFFFEGVEKLHTPSWSSAPYLRESTGPLAKDFRDMAGDPVLGLVELEPLGKDQDSARVPHNQRFPPGLGKAWDGFADRFIAHYKPKDDSDAKQFENSVRAKLAQRKEQTGMWLAGQGPHGSKKVTITKYGVTAEATKTTAERLAEYKAALKHLADLQEKEQQEYKKAFEANSVQALRRMQDPDAKTPYAALPGLNKDIADAKAEVTRQRADLLADVNQQTLEMKKALRDLLTPDQRNVVLPKAIEEKIKALPADKQAQARQEALEKQPQFGTFVEDEDPALLIYLNQAPVKNEASLRQYLAEPQAPTWSTWSWLSWDRLQWSDFLVRYGLLAVGACLLVGLLTRTACVAGAAFLLLFYLAMPPLPGLPANPRAEGHYLFINKNIIEMLALLALATTYSGRWVGLDGLLHYFSPFRRRDTAEPNSKTIRNKAKDLGPTRSEPERKNGAETIPLAADQPGEIATIKPHHSQE
jgi:uncharacterized membrane protein YphA (DoxX/SURF4 family)